MDQKRFQAEVEQALADSVPESTADDFPNDAELSGTDEYDDDHENDEDAMDDEADAFEDIGDEAFFGEDSFGIDDLADQDQFDTDDELSSTRNAVGLAVNEAMSANDTEEFFRRLLGAMPKPSILKRSKTKADSRPRGNKATGTRTSGSSGKGEVEGRIRTEATTLWHLLRVLRRQSQQGFDERESLEELVDEFSRGSHNQGLPVLAAIAARVALSPLMKRGVPKALRRQTVRSTQQAAQALVDSRGPRGIALLPRIADQVARRVARGTVDPHDIPEAIQQITSQALSPNKEPVANSSRETSSPSKVKKVYGQQRPQRLVLRGPVEIRILES